MAELPMLTTALARRIERHVAEGKVAELAQLECAGGEVKCFGETVALKAPGDERMTCVFCFGTADLPRLDEILGFYGDGRDQSPAFYVAPMRFSAEVGEALTAKGFVPTAFSQAMLYGLPRETASSMPEGMTIETVTPQTLETFAETTARGFG